ncbi:uncharacterized protein [Montipora capricornis]|uniref:uncharacterized protein n=1 Tax=Montipora capricornis TaxID=246305 RepID=UPI0035F12826
MESLLVLIASFLLMQTVIGVQSDIECQDMQDQILCREALEEGQCYDHPWSSKCRKTCGRCDECYDAENSITCVDEKEKGKCGEVETAHACSKTCDTLACSQEEDQTQLPNTAQT